MQYISLILLILYLLAAILFSLGLKIFKIYSGIGYLFGGLSLYLCGTTVLSQETNPLFHTLAGITVGTLVFPLSLFLTTLSFKEIIGHGFPFKGMAAYYRSRPLWAAGILVLCVVEEFMWRAVIQDYFGKIYLNSPYLSITLTAIIFTIIHKKNIQDDLLKKVEFFLFSLFLGYAYFVTHSLIFVILIHLTRNVNIEYRNSRKEGEANGEGILCVDSPDPAGKN